MMKKGFLLIVMMLVFGGMAEATTYTFDSDNQGWEQARVGRGEGTYETLLPNTPADWTNGYGVGSPDGSIYQDSNGWEGRSYWLGIKDITADTTLGDLTGQRLQTYVRSTGNWVGRVATDTVYARWTISVKDSNGKYNMWVSKAAHSLDLNAAAFATGTDSDWILESINMVETNFFQWPNSSNGGTFSDALIDYTSFGLTILPTDFSDDLSNFNGSTETWGSGDTLLHYGATGFSAETAIWGIDGFVAAPVPEPSTFLLLGSGLFGLGWYGRKRRKS